MTEKSGHRLSHEEGEKVSNKEQGRPLLAVD